MDNQDEDLIAGFKCIKCGDTDSYCEYKDTEALLCDCGYIGIKGDEE